MLAVQSGMHSLQRENVEINGAMATLSMTVEGKEYHWCPDHESWTRHKPSECKGIGFTKTQAKKDSDKVSDSKPKLKLSKALSAISSDEE